MYIYQIFHIPVIDKRINNNKMKTEEEKNNPIDNVSKPEQIQLPTKNVSPAMQLKEEISIPSPNDIPDESELPPIDNNKIPSVLQDEPEELEPPIKFRKKLLSTEEHKVYGNHLVEDYKYDNEGENGLFEALPRVVKISGFEINKKITVKIKVINKSKYGERIQIISPKSEFFKVRYTKRAQIPPGLAEVLYLTFLPQNYQYYTEKILINCPGAKIVIPIHAYPKMNIHVKDYIPKMIDIGNVTIDTTERKEIAINNIIDIPFTYEIRCIRPCDEITLSPMSGEFPAFNTKRLVASLTPKKYGIFRAEFEFRMSEIDFVPYTFTVYGTCHNFGIKRNYYDLEQEEMTKEEMLKNKALANEASKRNIEGDIKEEDLNASEGKPELKLGLSTDKVEEEKNNDDNKTQVLSQNKTESRPVSKTLSKFKDFPSNKEREFLSYYNTAENTIQSKEFKYIRFIGKKPLTEEEIGKINNERNDVLTTKIDTKCQNDKDLHSAEIDKELPEIDRDIKYYLKPNFNSNQNDNFFKTRHYFKLFLKGMTKVIIRKRADENLKKLNTMISTNNIKSRDDFRKYVDKAWIEMFSKDQSGKDDTSFNFLQMKFIPPTHLFRETIYLTNEFSLNSLKQEISHENNINLEEYPEFQPLEKSDLEVVGYKPFVSPGLTQFDVNVGEKELRPSCESEELIRSERGDSEMTFEKNEKIFDLPDSFIEHTFAESSDLIFNNPSLKKFAISTVLNKKSESDIDYNLQPRLLQSEYLPITNYQNETYMKIDIDYSNNDRVKIRAIDNETLLVDYSMEMNDIKKMNKLDQKDLNVKKGEKVDEDNYIYELKRDDDKAILDMIEKDDEKIAKVRELNKNGVYDVRMEEKINLENKMIMHKKKWMSTVPTAMEYFNSGIKNEDNKFIL